ncbi:glycosyltransferase involved in cell wall biosynthesis [Caulobacter ginsengisoli]|uniref:Glycosyltransferase involved in cell wall biosynthesis n=1 Tax=Caulobacter ginsengisoli TaxID=400775 RepID=A0ABU0IU37_9CAUL|nr:glycosyltransferase family 4 protein [Caulobacter ginsengisoli]MDQ0464925.1 glycosyltransferase involved in cell wall biosynthesis [Caulobacter ginsengisoli]
MSSLASPVRTARPARVRPTPRPVTTPPAKIVLFANTDWYLYNFRQSLARHLREAGHPLILISPDGAYGPKLIEAGFDWRALPMNRRSINPLAEAGLIWHLTRLLRREKADIIHGFTIKPAVYGALAGGLAGVKRVNAVAGLGYVFMSGQMQARALRPIVRTMARLTFDDAHTRLIVQNPDDHAAFVGSGLVSAGRTHIIPGSGVDCSRFKVSPRKREKGEALRILLAARMLWDKGLAEFVEAARALKAEGRNIEFLLAGEPDPGNPTAVPIETLKSWFDEGVVTWLGHVDDMPGLLAEVDVVALPSYREGLPKTLIEAAACALPLVTTDVPGCREVVTDGVDGLLVPVREWRPLAEAFARLDDDPALRARLGAAARQKALAQFDEKIVIERTMEVYRSLLG